MDGVSKKQATKKPKPVPLRRSKTLHGWNKPHCVRAVLQDGRAFWECFLYGTKPAAGSTAVEAFNRWALMNTDRDLVDFYLGGIAEQKAA